MSISRFGDCEAMSGLLNFYEFGRPDKVKPGKTTTDQLNHRPCVQLTVTVM